METQVPSILQVEIHNKHQSVVVFIETFHLPYEQDSLQFWLIRSFLRQVFKSSKTIYAWGDAVQRLLSFLPCNLITSDHLHLSKCVNIQDEYKQFDFRVFDYYRTGNHACALQNVITDVCYQFLDQEETSSNFSQGFDLPIKNIDCRAEQSLINYLVNQSLTLTRIAYILDKKYCKHD